MVLVAVHAIDRIRGLEVMCCGIRAMDAVPFMHDSGPMSSHKHLELIGRFYNDMWNRFDKDVFADILEPSIRFRGSLGQDKIGYEQLGDYVDFIQAFAPDFHNEVVTTITEGDRTFARLRYTGTHRGDIFGIPPTERRFEYAGAAIFTIPGARIADVWVLGDIHGLLGQLR